MTSAQTTRGVPLHSLRVALRSAVLLAVLLATGIVASSRAGVELELFRVELARNARITFQSWPCRLVSDPGEPEPDGALHCRPAGPHQRPRIGASN